MSSVFNDCFFDTAPSFILFSSLRSVIIPTSMSFHQSISSVNPLLLPLLPPFNHSTPSPVLPSGCQGNRSLFCGRSSFDIVFLLPAGQIADKEDKRCEGKKRVPLNARWTGLRTSPAPSKRGAKCLQRKPESDLRPLPLPLVYDGESARAPFTGKGADPDTQGCARPL